MRVLAESSELCHRARAELGTRDVNTEVTYNLNSMVELIVLVVKQCSAI